MKPERIAELRKRLESGYYFTKASYLDEALDEIERLQSSSQITGQRLASVLASHGIIQAQAVDSPEGYDNYETLEAVNAAARELSNP